MQTPSFDVQAEELRAACLAALRPRPSATVSEIAECNLYLSPEYSKVRGLVDLDMYPYLREPMNRLGPYDPVRVVAALGPIQGGKTIIGQGWVTYSIIANPGPIIWVTDTETKAELFSKKRFDLMVRDSPRLRQLVADPKSRNKDSTLRRKVFRGGDIEFVGAQSASGLTSNTYRDAVIDEADDHGENVSSAGSSVALAMGRQTTFGDTAKTLIVSSPKNKGSSEIEAWHDRGDQRVYHVPCPHCGEYQALHFRERDASTGEWEYRLVWDKGHPERAHYVCRANGCIIRNEDKNWMLPRGRWVATRPDLGEGGTITSYRWNCLYLPVGSYSFADLARQWDAAIRRMKAGDNDELRTVINTRLAETFEVSGDQIDRHALQDLVEPDWGDEIPDGVRVVVTGSDVHPYRRETMTLGIGAGWEMWILDHAVSLASPLDRTGWAELDGIRRRRWMTEDGRELVSRANCVDAGFQTQRVLEYCTPKFAQRVYAIMGDDRKGPIWSAKVSHGGKNKNKGRFWTVHVNTAKNDLYDHLKVRDPGPKRIHIPDRLLAAFPDFLDQLTNERRVRDKSGRYVWEKKASHLRNEVWDCLVYCLAAAHSLVMGGLRLDVDPHPEPTEPRTRRHVDPAPAPRDPGYVRSSGGYAPATGPRAPDPESEW